ncbi:MAG: glycosyltransferase family 39 protein [Flavipsychrobacter sp.]|jgi:4-amino-4-deoxy-L-arabinose transferase-like glycosyltransferase|nr:glycosyltransferase family 39 protein [Flavipsychrobacter sp.]
MPNYLRYAGIALIAGLLFIPFLGNVHLFDWDEINFAECAREMIVSKDYLRAQIDFMPFWEKPPFFIWMQVLAMKLFGVGEFAARLPNAITGIITLTTLFYVGKRIANEKLAGWWVLLYAATWLPHFYFKSGIIDPIFNLFIFLAFFQVHLLRFSEKKVLHAMLAGLFLGMAVLTKGPVAILVAVLALSVYLVVNKGFTGYKIKHLLLVAFCALLPILLWMGSAIAAHGMAYGKWFITQFITYQVRLFSTEDADHGGPFVYHFIVLLFGCFPASVFLFQYTHKRVTHNLHAHDFTRWMWILFWVVLILFSIVKTKIVHYSSLCYFPLTYLAALQLYRLGHEPAKLKTTVKWLLLFTGSIVAILIIALPVIGINKEKLIPYIQDPFAVGNLAANVSWSYSECVWGVIYLIGIWATVLMMEKSFRNGMIALCIIQLVTIQVTVLHFTPKIEAYSQRAAIEYFKSFRGKDVYVKPLGYMSYAHLFYTQKLPATEPDYYSHKTDSKGRKISPVANEDWLLAGKIDKPAYFICKIQDKSRYSAHPQLVITGEENGFVFLRRQ